MSKLKMFVTYDSKAESYSRPFFDQNLGSVRRAFSDIANDPQHPIGQHPEDYTLFEIGEYDDQTGQSTMHTAKQSLGLAIEYKKSEE